jgi:hypothetical protein
MGWFGLEMQNVVLLSILFLAALANERVHSPLASCREATFRAPCPEFEGLLFYLGGEEVAWSAYCVSGMGTGGHGTGGMTPVWAEPRRVACVTGLGVYVVRQSRARLKWEAMVGSFSQLGTWPTGLPV